MRNIHLFTAEQNHRIVEMDFLKGDSGRGGRSVICRVVSSVPSAVSSTKHLLSSLFRALSPGRVGAKNTRLTAVERWGIWRLRVLKPASHYWE